ncbi:hypothetical protein [Ktedonospora formicarum]|uniref:Uncharacterized protein n=1 Tax=Ktedonospora formicarum TaxID=2778364 RepID=A0A8J3IEV0_9CHLR|nr:hypothetical protein [Ktedonospora formicarum]GHO49944.1 hypothetical protein KSX_81070 [Ktedonospora formicarum]
MPHFLGSSAKPVLDAFNESHGRLTRRRVFVHAVPTELQVLEDWQGTVRSAEQRPQPLLEVDMRRGHCAFWQQKRRARSFS